MTTLVTGAAGFIGHALAKALLARGDTVIGIDRLTPYYRLDLKQARLADLAGPGFHFLAVDFADMKALAAALAALPATHARVERIVHLGAQPGVRASIEQPLVYGHSNLLGHLNLLEIARAHAVPMVYASSSSVYGNSETLPSAPTDRTDFPVSLYAATKKSAELMSESYAHLYHLPLTGLRLFTVYGPWGRPDMAVWKFVAHCLAGTPAPVFNIDRASRDFTYIDDVVAGILAALDRPPANDGRAKSGGSHAPHAIYNLGSSHPHTLRQLIAAVEAACGRALHCTPLPAPPGDVGHSHADLSATTRALGYRPRIGLTDGVHRFVDWYRRWTGAPA